MQKAFLILALFFFLKNTFAQEVSIRDLDFLIGKWEVREDNKEKAWWEKTVRTAAYTLDSTYIELESVALSSSGKKRTYRWLIHYNAKSKQFEMVSMFSNWHKIQFDILEWDKEKRKLIVRNGKDPGSNEYHERFGEITFDENLNNYTWIGENKSGDPNDPSVWKYVEIGSRMKN